MRAHQHPTPSPELLKEVMGLLVMRGETLSSWARMNGIAKQNARKALIGEWTGPKAAELVMRIYSEARGRDAA